MSRLSTRLLHSPTDRRDLSGELHVFEASGYMSGGFIKPPKTVAERHLNSSHEAAVNRHKAPHQSYSDRGNKEVVNEMAMPTNTSKKAAKKAVFPSGGSRLGRFLTSLFHQHGTTFGNKEQKTKSVKSDEEEHNSNESYGWKKRQRRWRRRSSTGQFDSRASVSSEPMAASSALSATGLSKPRIGYCGSEFAVPFVGDGSRRVHVRKQMERGLDPFDIDDDQVEKRWTLNKGGAGMVIVTEEMVEGVVRPKGRGGHLWRREEVEEQPWRRGGASKEEESSDDDHDDDDNHSCDLFELPVFDGDVSKVEL